MEQTLTRQSITHALATRLVDAVREAAVVKGKPFVAAVVDEDGILKAFLRMDGAKHVSVQVALDKAFTSSTGRPTHLWHELLEKDEVLGAGARNTIPRLATLGGGFPVVVDDAVVGAIGVSGGHWSEDMEVATAALRDAGLKDTW